MQKTVAVIGALDTKGQELGFLKAEIERRGCSALVIDTGVLGEPAFTPDVTRVQVLDAAGKDLNSLTTRRDRGEAIAAMAEAAAILVQRLYGEDRFHGIVSMGGSAGTAVATSAMRSLPIGIPKLMVSTMAAGDVSAYVGTSDITMMPSVVDVSGVNRISRTIFTNAAGAITGMVLGEVAEAGDKPVIAATMFGNTTIAVDHARSILENRGYEVLVFHATGAGGRTMESLVAGGYVTGVLDMTTTEWADELCGGVLNAGPERLDAAARAGIPQVVVPGCIDMCNFRAPETVPERWKQRKLYVWNPQTTLMRTTPEENARVGEIFAEKLNSATGPVEVMIPRGGFSQLDSEGGPFWWPEADAAFVEALRANLRPEIRVVEMASNINDPEFSGAAAAALLRLLGG